MDIKEFLKREDIQDALRSEDLDYVYLKYDFTAKCYLTEFFLDNNINPLQYVSKIHAGMYHGIEADSIIIPNNITIIGEYAFNWCQFVMNIDIPNSVTAIGEYAFEGCRSLESLTMPDSIIKIGGYMFAQCPALIDIKYNGTKEQWIKIRKSDYWNRFSNIKEIICIDGTLKV